MKFMRLSSPFGGGDIYINAEHIVSIYRSTIERWDENGKVAKAIVGSTITMISGESIEVSEDISHFATLMLAGSIPAIYHNGGL